MSVSQSTSISANIEGIIENLEIQDFMSALYELTVNSLQAIEEKNLDKSLLHEQNIIITIEREQESNTCITHPIKAIEIRDTGIGLNKENFESFTKAYSQKKAKIGGKGIGRFAALAVFNELHIESVYNDGDGNKKRTFYINRKTGQIENITNEPTKEPPATKITLTKLRSEFSDQSAKKTNLSIAQNILEHCLLYYLSGNAPSIEIRENDSTIRLNDLFKNHTLITEKRKNTLREHDFSFYAIKQPNKHTHMCHFCAHNRVTKSKRIHSIFPLFDSAITRDNDSFHIALYVVSPTLDTMVKQSRNGFKFPTESEQNRLIQVNYVTEEEIDKLVIDALNSMFNENIEQWQQTLRKKIEHFVSSDDGVAYRNMKIENDVINALRGNSTSKDIRKTLALHRFNRSESMIEKRDKLFERDYSNTQAYNELCKEVINLLDEENNRSLAEYVAHRNTILKLLEKMLEWKNHNQEYEEEQHLHNLIYTMGGTQDQISYDKHNLWLLDDRLTYYRYINSDKAIKNHKPIEGASTSLKETDLALYDTTFYYGDKDDDGHIKTVVIFEFKRPNRNISYLEYIKQSDEQIQGIFEGIIKSEQGRNFRVEENTPIFFYYVCDENAFDSLKKDLCNFHNYTLSPYKTLVKFNTRIHHEIITFQQLLANAKRRNKIFFDKLGL